MGRAVLEPLALFLSPFAVSRSISSLRARYPLAVEHWTRGRVSILTLVGLAAAVLGLVAITPSRRAATASTFPRMSKTACSFRDVSNDRAPR